MLKTGDRSLASVEKAYDYAHDNPAFTPSYLGINEFDKDFSDAHGLWRLLTAIRRPEEAVSDTIMAAGAKPTMRRSRFITMRRLSKNASSPRLFQPHARLGAYRMRLSYARVTHEASWMELAKRACLRYSLTYEEVKVIEPEFLLSRAEYEGIGVQRR
jgi:hypothetical protein